ncbi:5'-3' exoribonuclease [Mycena chlorophos]|uniref:5'-3' exoribonuclease n=1 Tax=Mycena chlorophos TaxID=658473 RepID=A0A8H6WIJ4_MYCCL|nr:5'-3' exoribonuclease [Mycena chlorophos]
MGVPALFRWLSKKYPKIIYPVVEEEEIEVAGENDAVTSIPVNMSMPNPNGKEFDNLYLDMNGIVHPCTHPEGKPAPETEEEMMLEVFKYTERVVNMVRPRKVLFMAIDGVAPRAKMNQQRSRRFRAAQDAKDKEIARQESLLMWKAMGKEVTDFNEKEGWDTNAITPGTPFMDLLASSLRYWVVHKMNTDPGWKNIQVIISDAGVPGEGEHKIMDWIRRQRLNSDYNPNTRHVIYGLDADLIMLGIATHEPNFWVLREDVFADSNSNACRKCGLEGHYAAECTATEPVEKPKKAPDAKKPFIFLDIAILREYLEVELDVPEIYFPYNFEQAVDDWVLLIFFVGNDFLPHLPSLEIREGAIDTLLRIWKQELPRMGGYLTNHGHMVLERAQIILEGLAQREDEIFRKRRETETRQDENAKRRKIEADSRKRVKPSSSLSLTALPAAPHPVHPSLPPRPNFAANADALGFGAQSAAHSAAPIAAQALAGSNHDVVANRRAIRMANMSAAEMLKAELNGAVPVRPNPSLPPKPVTTLPDISTAVPATPTSASAPPSERDDDADAVPGLGTIHSPSRSPTTPSHVFNGSTMPVADSEMMIDEPAPPVDDDSTEATTMNGDASPSAAKRKLADMEEPDVEEETFADDDDAPPNVSVVKLKVNADGTVDQEDTVKLWEPGYKERYYDQKFPDQINDPDLRKKITTAYIEGLCWVLHYYYQGTPSWQWFYPYHFAPFAADFVDVKNMPIKFNIGNPFKPFEQLMGVFPAASRKQIPAVFHPLMTDPSSPLRGASNKENMPTVDFYPEEFQIDMNGKRMAWQGVALLPFIDERALLDNMAKPLDFLSEEDRPVLNLPSDLPPPKASEPPYSIYLTAEERKRNSWGNNVIFASNEHPIYPFYEQLYGKRKSNEPLPLDTKLSFGMSGSVAPNPDCLPGSTYYSTLPDLMPDVKNDQSLSVYYFFPKQSRPHQSVLLPGARKPQRVLSGQDLETVRRGGRGRGRGGGNGNYNGGRSDRGPGGRNDMFHSRPHSAPPSRDGYGGRGYDRGGDGNDRGYHPANSGFQRQPPPPHMNHHNQHYPPIRSQPPAPPQYGGHGQSSGNYRGYGGPPPPSQGNYGGYGGGGYGGNGYGGYGQGYNGHGGPPPPPPNNYGGYGGYGGYQQGGFGGPPPPQQNYGGYGGPPPQSYGPGRGGYNNANNSRGRGGRGW